MQRTVARAAGAMLARMKPASHLEVDQARIIESLRQAARKPARRARTDVSPKGAQVTAKGNAALQRKKPPPQP
jgi:hypothetical protein